MAAKPVEKTSKEKHDSIKCAISAIESLNPKRKLPSNLYMTVTKDGIEDMVDKIDKPYYSEENEKILKPYYEGCYHTIKDLAGKPYERIRQYLDKFKRGAIQDLFRRGGVSEILTKEVCYFIADTFTKTGAQMIYFHNAGAGAESFAFKQSNVFKDFMPPIRVFDKYPEKNLIHDYYDDVIKMNIKDKIIFEEDLDKRILVVSVAPICSMRNDILKGMENNKENYVGIIFIGEIIKGLNIDDDLHNELVKIDYEFATFSIFPSVSCHDIYDDDLNLIKMEHLKVAHTSNQLFFINQHINKSYVVNIENFMMLNSIHRSVGSNLIGSLISCMIEHTYFMNTQGILWDLKLDAFANLNLLVHYKIRFPELTDGDDSGMGIPLPNNIIIEYYKAIKRIKYQVNIIIFLRQSMMPELLEIKRRIIPTITYKTDTLYKQQIYNLIEDKCKNHQYYHRLVCQVCIKEQKFICKGCGVHRYCSKECQKIDWKYLGHKHQCQELKKCRINFKEQLTTDQDKKVETLQIKAQIRQQKIKDKKDKKLKKKK